MPLPIYLGTAALLWSRVFSPLFPVFSSSVSPAPMIKCFQYVEHYFFFAFDSVFDSAYTVDRGKGKALCLLHLAGGPLLCLHIYPNICGTSNCFHCFRSSQDFFHLIVVWKYASWMNRSDTVRKNPLHPPAIQNRTLTQGESGKSPPPARRGFFLPVYHTS